ncbi:MAG: alpha/beta hydrolase [Polyangiales bacterium]
MPPLPPRAIVEALWSLRGPVDNERPPTVSALRYRAESRRGIAPLLDLWAPRAPATGSAVLLVHGGGFTVGHRAMKPMRLLASRLCDAGFAVASADYRMILRGGRLDESLDDARAAFAFWHETAQRRGWSDGRTSLVGLSAGGALAVLAASGSAVVPHRLVGCFGLYDFDDLRGPLASLLPRLLLRTRDPSTWRARSPLEAPPTPAPTLLLHGTHDTLVPITQARRLAARRLALGRPTRLVELVGAPHAFFNTPGEAADRALGEILAHLDAP